MMKIFSSADIAPNSTNIFNIPESENYSCRVMQYVASHSKLVIMLHHRLKTGMPFNGVYLIFTFVLYFEGPFWWEGANFCSASREELVRLQMQIHARQKINEQQIHSIIASSNSTAECLFLVQTANLTVKILSSQVILTQEPPQGLPNLFRRDK
jgi:hypothetical protein